MPGPRGRAPTSRPTLQPSKASLGSSVMSISAQQREGAVVELHRGALGGLDRVGDLEQAQLDRGVGAEHLAAGDAEQQRVADLAGGAGDGDLDGGAHEFVSSDSWFASRQAIACCRFSSIEARNSWVVWNSWSAPTSSARSLVILPLSTVSTQTRSSVSANSRDLGRVVHPAAGGEAAGPGEDRGDRVGRGRLALLVLAEVAGDGAVRGLGLDRLAVGASSARWSSGRASRSPGRRCRTGRRRRSSCRPRRSRPPTSAPRRPCRRSGGARR